MKITGTSSYIKIEIESKILIIKGERLINGFLAYSDTLLKYEPPFDKEIIGIDEKLELINMIITEGKKNNFIIEFE